MDDEHSDLSEVKKAIFLEGTISKRIMDFPINNYKHLGTTAIVKKLMSKNLSKAHKIQISNAYKYWVTYSKAEHLSLESFLMIKNDDQQYLNHVNKIAIHSNEIGIISQCIIKKQF